MNLNPTFLHAAAALGSVLTRVDPVIDAVRTAMANGTCSAEDARDIGYAAAKSLGDIKYNVKGQDIIHLEATQEILGGVARIVRQVILANR